MHSWYVWLQVHSWGEPERATHTLITTTASVCIYVCMYVSNIFTRVCHTLVSEICVRHKMLCVFWCIYVLMCMITEKSKDRSYSLFAVKIINEDR